MKLERIVVGVDGSANSITALTWAADVARLSGAEVVAVHASGLLERFDGEDEITARFESDWCEPLDAAPVRSRRILRHGNPVSVLLAVADEEDADLVVVGSKGVGDRSELLLGSTSSQVAQQAAQPVTVVPAGGTDRPVGRAQQLVLQDGRAVRVRPWRAGDTADLGGVLEPADAGSGGDFALVALDDAGETIAVARYRSEPGRATATAEVAVVPAWRTVGLGTRLLVLLGLAAWERGIRRFTARYPAENTHVGRLVQASGLPHTASVDAGTAALEIDLAGPDPA